MGVNGLAAGQYMLLPAHYALLPGAYSVKLVAGTQNFGSQQNMLNADGSMLVSGYRMGYGGLVADAGSHGFLVASGNIARLNLVIGSFEFFKRLNAPNPFLRSTTLSFESLKLDPQILRALDSVGYKTPTPIQAKSIPVIMEGHDLMASAQTGTGKTAAFILPALNLLATPHPVKERGPRILVLTPTRELAAQINEAARKYGTFIKAKTTSIVGGMPYPLQNKLLSQPLDILIATPGRLLDHMERGRINLSRLQMLVLDEADRMLDMGFIPDVKKICAAINTKHQTLLFSATLDGQISKIAKDLLHNPKTN